MSAKKTRANHENDHSVAAPAGAPQSPFHQNAAAPSSFQKCLLAIAIALETSWLAALVTMALAE